MAMIWRHDISLGAVNAGVLLYHLKEWLKACGWTVRASGDGTSTFSTSADIITSSGSGANGFSNAAAWIVLYKAGREVCFQHNNAVGGCFWESYSAGFIGGTPGNTRRPEATDEKVFTGSGSAAVPTYATFCSNTATRKVHIGADPDPTRATFLLIEYHSSSSQVDGIVALDDRVTGIGSDPAPYLICGRASSAYSLSSSHLIWKAWFRKGLSGEDMAACPVWYIDEAGTSSANYPRGSADNPFNDKKQIFPAMLGRSAGSTDPDHAKGMMSIAKIIGQDLGGDANKPKTLNVFSERDWMVLGDYAFRWDGYELEDEDGNFDAEIFDLSGAVDVIPLPPALSPHVRLLRESSMALSKLAKISTNLTQSDRVLNQVITNLNQIADDPLLNYYEAQDIHFADGESVLLNHRLGRPYKGWVITRLQNVTGAPAWTEVTEGESGTVDIKRQIRIRQTGGGNVVASVRVF